MNPKNNKAYVTALWIGEEKPDTFSSLIQWILRTKYSHNAFIFEGEIWHGTCSDDPEFDGFCNEPIERALKDSIVRYCKTVETTFTVEELRGYLRARKGTPYSMSQNLAAVRPVLFDWPIVRLFFRNGKFKINCSEVLAEICQGPLYNFGKDLDRVKPTDTFLVLKPDPCQHSHVP